MDNQAPKRKPLSASYQEHMYWYLPENRQLPLILCALPKFVYTQLQAVPQQKAGER